MNTLLHSRTVHISIAVLLIGIAIFSLVRATKNEGVTYITTTVERGDVTEIISVSGSIEADHTAELSFPVGGTIAKIDVSEGDEVVAGQLLASLTQADLKADRQDAYAALLIARANKEELLSGPTVASRSVTDTNVSIAQENITRTTLEQNKLVENAELTMLSSNLEAVPSRKSNSDIPPTITGTYRCDPGSYILDVFSSNAQSGYSYKLSGIESGTYTAYTEAAAPLGSCGLAIQFVANVTYGGSEWTITIPNTLSATYATNLNAYELALKQRSNAITAAEQALTLAENQAVVANASPREESVDRANAAILQAQARLASIDAALNDRSIVAPFDGTITLINAVAGESLGSAPLVTMVANNTFKLKARIPEIDVTKITKGLHADVVFDARADAVLPATITFISPLATEIDGVAYFEATLDIENPPTWIRGGLNADIDIEIHKVENALRIPKRFINVEEDGTHTVLVPDIEGTRSVDVEEGFVGNDGFVEIIGFNEGDTIVAP